MRNLLLSSALLASALSLSGPVLASNDDRPAQAQTQGTWMSVAEVAARFTEQGYTVRSIETEKGVYEVKAIDPNGMRVEAYVDPVTGQVLNGSGSGSGANAWGGAGSGDRDGDDRSGGDRDDRRTVN